LCCLEFVGHRKIEWGSENQLRNLHFESSKHPQIPEQSVDCLSWLIHDAPIKNIYIWTA
jgi:hypothetical protein